MCCTSRKRRSPFSPGQIHRQLSRHLINVPATKQVAATLPFQLPPCLAFTTVIYGLSGLRPEAGAVLANGALAAMMSLIAVQVGGLVTDGRGTSVAAQAWAGRGGGRGG